MIRHALLGLLLLPGVSFAVICKTVDAGGVVSYEDVAASQCPEPVKLPPESRYTPRPIEQPAASASEEKTESDVFQGYRSIRIEQPAPDSSVRSNEGLVPVSIALEPALQAGHRVTLTLDGAVLSGSFDGLAIELSGVERGTHSLRAAIEDADGKRLIESQPVSFTLRKTGLYDGAPRPTPRPARPPG